MLFAVYLVQALFYLANLIAIIILLSHIRSRQTKDQSMIIYQSILSLDAILSLVNVFIVLWKVYLCRKMGKISGNIITQEEMEELKEKEFERRDTDYDYRNEEEGTLRYQGMESDRGSHSLCVSGLGIWFGYIGYEHWALRL